RSASASTWATFSGLGTLLPPFTRQPPAGTAGGAGDAPSRDASTDQTSIPCLGRRIGRSIKPCRAPAVYGSLFSCGWNPAAPGLRGPGLDEVHHFRGRKLDPGAHGGGEGHLPEVLPLGRGRPRPDNGIQDGPQVLPELLLGEGDLPDGDVDASLLVDPELHLPRLDLPHRPAHIHGDRARLGVGHQAPGPQDPPKPTYHTH